MHEATGQSTHAWKCLERVAGNCQCNGRHFFDPATGQAALRTRFTIVKGTKPVARGAEDAFTTADAVASVGPISLADYGPGSYVVRLDVTDKVANQTLRQEVPFEIRQP